MLLDKLQADLKEAQLNRDEVRVSTLRLLLSEIHNTRIQKGAEISDQDIVPVIRREAKKRKEAAVGFRSGNREELALKEEAELKILEDYLPAGLTNEELTKIVLDTISEACQLALVNELGRPSLQDMGKIIRLVMEKVSGRADGGVVSALVKERLSK